MAWLLHLNLIRFFEFYLAVAFLFGTAFRIRQYRAIVGLVRTFPGRWPRLLQLVKGHYNIFLTWGTVLPAALALGLLLLNTLARRVFLEGADLTVALLLKEPPAVPVVAVLGAAMLCFDAYAAWNVGQLDRGEMEKYFDQAEYWLKSWAAPVVHFFTFGYINPRQMVAVEVRVALENASQLVNSTLWWVIAQTGLRLAYGLSLWLTFAFSSLP